MCITEKNYTMSPTYKWILDYYRVSGTRLPQKLHSMKQEIIWVLRAVSWTLSGDIRILYVLANPMTLSISTCLLAIFLSFQMALGGNWFLPVMYVGMLMVTSYGAKISCTLNPLSDMTTSVGSHDGIRGLLSHRLRSLADPPYAGDM